MAVTNAISGIIIVGAMLQVVDINGQTLTVTSVLGAVGIFPGQHQHLRRLPGHPAHARHVQEEK